MILDKEVLDKICWTVRYTVFLTVEHISCKSHTRSPKKTNEGKLWLGRSCLEPVGKVTYAYIIRYIMVNIKTLGYKKEMNRNIEVINKDEMIAMLTA